MEIRPILNEGWQEAKVPVSLKRLELENSVNSYISSGIGAVMTSSIQRYGYSLSFNQLNLSESTEMTTIEEVGNVVMIFVIEGAVGIGIQENGVWVSKNSHILAGISPSDRVLTFDKGKHLMCAVSFSREHLLGYPQNEVVRRLAAFASGVCPESVLLPVAANTRWTSERLELLIRRACPSEFDRQIFERQDIDELFRRYIRSVEPRGPQPRTVTTTLKKLNQVRYFLVDNPGENISLKEIAKSFGMPINKLKSGFKEQYGTAVRSFQLQQRVEMAKKLLLRGDRKITDVALECGFCDSSHLNKMFKMVTGINPSDYRKGMSQLVSAS